MLPRFGEDRRDIPARLAAARATMIVAFCVLAASFWFLQIAQHAKYQEMAENNHQRTLTLRAPRGVVFDKNGRVLVENRFALNISLVRDPKRDGRGMVLPPDLNSTVQLLARITGTDPRAIHDRIDRRKREPKFRPIVLIEDATLPQVVSVLARHLELPNIIIERVPTRQYPTDQLAAHLFGYVGEVSETQLERTEFQHLEPGAIVGQAGVEQVYNGFLMGRDGAKRVVVNSVGREKGVVGQVNPIEGKRIQLTIDYDVQRAGEEAFRVAGKTGTAIVLDPQSGEILALVSVPAYDPNDFAVKIDRTTFNLLNNDPQKPFENRAIRSRYSPGSAFKLAVGTAALEEGIITPKFRVTCYGGAVFYGRFFQCWKKEGHGTVDFEQALAQSCNTYFYTVGNMTGIDRIARWATALGLGEKTGVDLPNELAGLVPSSEWKRREKGEKWYAGETVSVSIGQGQVWVTPISLAVVAATIANGGTLYRPHVMRAVQEDGVWRPAGPREPRKISKLKPETLQAIRMGMWRVVNDYGTAARARIPGKDVAGKTSTSQVISLGARKALKARSDLDLRDHGWFVFFAPRDRAQIAGCVFVEHGESGGLAAAPIARVMMETFFAKREGRPLPEIVPPRPVPPVAAQTVAPAGEQ